VQQGGLLSTQQPTTTTTNTSSHNKRITFARHHHHHHDAMEPPTHQRAQQASSRIIRCLSVGSNFCTERLQAASRLDLLRRRRRMTAGSTDVQNKGGLPSGPQDRPQSPLVMMTSQMVTTKPELLTMLKQPMFVAQVGMGLRRSHLAKGEVVATTTTTTTPWPPPIRTRTRTRLDGPHPRAHARYRRPPNEPEQPQQQQHQLQTHHHMRTAGR
jgi:hypothetical protein